jgi:hypothetical protein
LSQAEIEQCKKAADYESASELLKKIKAEKLAKEQEQKKNSNKKKSKEYYGFAKISTQPRILAL